MRGPFFTLLTIAFAEVVRLVALYAMIAAMWVFPEAGVKKGDVKRAK
jgi:hypothetical protein